MTESDILALGYSRARRLPNGEWLALSPMIFTTGLCLVREPPPGDEWSNGLRTRFCYEDPSAAAAAFVAWDGAGDPPGPWIKQKPEGRLNPRWLAHARDELSNRARVERDYGG